MTTPRLPNKDMRQLVREIEAAGGEIRQSKRNRHLKIYLDGRLVCTLSSTPSEWRAIKNARAQLRRSGFDV